MDKATAVQNTVNAVAVTTQAINEHGRTSPEAVDALDLSLQWATAARQLGASDDDFRTTRPV
jgi:hypothetical protein